MINGELVPIDEVTANAQSNAGPTILADLPDFVSPIDGSVVRGRAGMRDHCARHDVVPTAELAGLPFKRMYQPTEPSREHREETKRTIAQIMNSRNY
jgi:hypothetical protein